MGKEVGFPAVFAGIGATRTALSALAGAAQRRRKERIFPKKVAFFGGGCIIIYNKV